MPTSLLERRSGLDWLEHAMRPLDPAQKIDPLMRIVVCAGERGNLGMRAASR